jgi:hypothetical protein
MLRAVSVVPSVQMIYHLLEQSLSMKGMKDSFHQKSQIHVLRAPSGCALHHMLA